MKTFTINVLGALYTVKEDMLVGDTFNRLGSTCNVTREILLKKDIKDDVQFETFIHELVHALIFETGRIEEDLKFSEEEMCNMMGSFYKWMEPAIREYIKAGFSDV